MGYCFAGRRAELAVLERALADAVAGHGSTVLVCGEAGIGKTRLVNELLGRLGESDVVVLTGRCIDFVGVGVPYLPLVEALRPLRGSPALEAASVRLRTLARLVPGLGSKEVDGPDGPTGGDPPLFGELWSLLEQLTDRAPTVLVLEDLHWADDSTLDLVRFLAHVVPGRRALVVATYRDDEPGSEGALRRLVTELHRGRAATLLPLGPLTRDEVDAMLAGADETLVESIATRAQGNPFFVEELAAAPADGEPGVPAALRATLLQRVAQLSEGGRQVVRVAAVSGGDIAYRMFAAVLPMRTARLQAALREAVERRVLVPDQPTESYRFRHALLAEAVYGTLLPGERGELHARLAEALSGDATLSASGSVTGELAQHWAAAGRPAEAVAASARAAREAESVSGRAEALRHLERVISLWSRVPTAESLAGMDLPTVLAWAADLAHLTGAGPRAIELSQCAIDVLAGEDDATRVSALHERLGTYLLPTGAQEAGLAAFRRAVDLAPALTPSSHRVRVLAALGHALMLATRYEESRSVCAEAIEVATAVGDEREVLRARDVLALDLCYLGQAAQGIPMLRAAGQDNAIRRELPDLMRPTVFLSDALLMVGELPEAVRVAERGLASARRLGLASGVGTVLAANLGEALLGIGDWARAEAVLTTAQRTVASFWSHHIHVQCAALALGRGHFDAAAESLQCGAQASREPANAGPHAALVAELALWQGRLDDAGDAVDRGLRDSPVTTHGGARARLCALGLRTEADRARIAAARRDAPALHRTRRRTEHLVTEARRAAAAGPPEARAWAATAEAYASASRSDPDLWLVAVAHWERLGRPYQVATCSWHHAAALLASDGSTVEAKSAAREAHRIAIQLGAEPLRREVEGLAHLARVDLAESPRGTEPAPLGLTAREDQVLQLVARGYSNREIAAELTISPKTASVHVSHIMRKLGVSRRLDAATIAHLVGGGPSGYQSPSDGPSGMKPSRISSERSSR